MADGTKIEWTDATSGADATRKKVRERYSGFAQIHRRQTTYDWREMMITNQIEILKYSLGTRPDGVDFTSIVYKDAFGDDSEYVANRAAHLTREEMRAWVVSCRNRWNYVERGF